MVGYRRFYHPLHSQIQTFHVARLTRALSRLTLHRESLRFSILQLLGFVTVAAVAAFFIADRWIVKYPCKSIEDTKGFYGGWRFVEHVGSCDGPYRRTGVSQIPKNCHLKLTWVRDGVETLHQTPSDYRDSDLLVVYYVNRNGDRFFTLFDQQIATEQPGNGSVQ